MDSLRRLEANMGLTHDIFHIADASTPEIIKLRERFKEEPIFTEVITIMELDQGVSLK